MHRFQSQSTITRLKLSAVLICLKYLLVPATACTLIYSLVTGNQQLTYIAIAMGAATLLAIVLQWAISQPARCPLCMTPVLANKRCSKHRNAKTALGSYRLQVALTMIFRGWFRCPYCNEPSELQLRNRPPASSNRR